MSSVDFKAVIENLTFSKMSPLWYRSFAQNMPAILAGGDIKDLPKHPNESALVIGAGPSIERFRQLDVLEKSEWNKAIICADKELIPLLKRRILPLAVCTVDGDAVISKFYKHQLVRKYADEITAVFNAVTVHPEVVKAWKGKICWFLPMWDDIMQPTSLTRAFHLMTGKTLMETYGNSGSASWALAYFLGFSTIGIMGLDYSYLTDKPQETTYFETFKILCGGNLEKISGCYKRVATWAGHTVLTDNMWLVYLQMFLPALENAKAMTYNLSPTSIIITEKVKGMDISEFLKMYG